MSDVSEFYGHVPKSAPAKSTNGPFCLGSYLGVEVELEGIENAPNLGGWARHRDGSLRGNSAEYVFNEPQWSDQAYRSLINLEEGIRDKEIKPSCSVRTSVHVHVDVREFSRRQLYNLAMIYSVFEKSLFKTYAPKRESNHFCVPVYASEEIQDAIRALQNGTFREFHKRVTNMGGRYGAMNLYAVQKFGTVEFRHHGGEWKTGPLREWVDALLSLKKFAVEFEHGNVIDFFTHISAIGFANLTNQVFPADIAAKIRAHDLDDCVLAGVRTAQAIHYDRRIVPPPRGLLPEAEDAIKEDRFAAVAVDGGWIDPPEHDADIEEDYDGLPAARNRERQNGIIQQLREAQAPQRNVLNEWNAINTEAGIRVGVGMVPQAAQEIQGGPPIRPQAVPVEGVVADYPRPPAGLNVNQIDWQRDPRQLNRFIMPNYLGNGRIDWMDQLGRTIYRTPANAVPGVR